MSVVSANNNALSAITALPSAVAGGGLNLISTQTASSSATLSFTSGIDSTYKEYIFKSINIHPATDNVDFTFNASTDTGSNYNVTKTTTYFRAYHDEADSSTDVAYNTANDIAQGTGGQGLAGAAGSGNMGNVSDESMSGELMLFNPSSTTFVKHYIARVNYYHAANLSVDTFIAGYFNTTSDIDAVQFAASTGNFDGTIKLYGIKDS